MRERMRAGDTSFLSNPGQKKRVGGGRKANVIRVLIAEDHTVVRDGLVAIIKQEADMDVVAETGDGQQAAELWKQHRPDITLMDLRMPGMDGVNAIYQIRAASRMPASSCSRRMMATRISTEECAAAQNRSSSRTCGAKNCSSAFARCTRAGRSFHPPSRRNSRNDYPLKN